MKIFIFLPPNFMNANFSISPVLAFNMVSFSDHFLQINKYKSSIHIVSVQSKYWIQLRMFQLSNTKFINEDDALQGSYQLQNKYLQYRIKKITLDWSIKKIGLVQTHPCIMFTRSFQYPNIFMEILLLLLTDQAYLGMFMCGQTIFHLFSIFLFYMLQVGSIPLFTWCFFNHGYKHIMYQNYSSVIPDHFIAKEKFLSSGMDMKIKVDGKKVGLINQRTFTAHKTFEYTDNDGKLICKAKKKLIGTHYEITDENDNVIGNVDKEKLKSAMSFGQVLSLKNSQGNIVGQSKQTEFFKSQIEVFDNDGNLLADMKKGVLNLTGDKWDCHIKGNVDRRLIIFLPAFMSEKQED